MCAAAALCSSQSQKIFPKIEECLINLSKSTHLINWATQTLSSMNTSVGKEYLVSHIKQWQQDAATATASMKDLLKIVESVEMSAQEKLKWNAFQYLCSQAKASYDRLPTPTLLAQKISKQSYATMNTALSSEMTTAVSTIREIFATIIQNSISAMIVCHPDASYEEQSQAERILREANTFLSDWKKEESENPEDVTPSFDKIETDCISLSQEETTDAVHISTSMRGNIQLLIETNHPPALEISIATLTQAIKTLLERPKFQALSQKGLNNLFYMIKTLYIDLDVEQKQFIKDLYKKTTQKDVGNLHEVIDQLKSLDHNAQLAFITSCYNFLVQDIQACNTFLLEIYNKTEPDLLPGLGEPDELLTQTNKITFSIKISEKLYGYKKLAANVLSLLKKPDRTTDETALLLHCLAFYQKKNKER